VKLQRLLGLGGQEVTNPSPTNVELAEEIVTLKRRIRELEKSEMQLRCTEEVLKKSEELYRKATYTNQLLLDTSPAFIVVIGLDGKTLMMNQALLDALEYTAAEIQGVDYLTTFVPEEERDGLREVFGKIVGEGKAVVQENRVVSKSGRTYLVEWHSQPVVHEEGEERNVFVWVGIDITTRKQSEEELRKVTAFLDSVVENIPDMIFVKDARDLRFVRFNRAGEELLGYGRDELMGKNDYDFFPKEQAAFFTQKDRDVLRKGKTVEIPKEPIQTRHKGERTLHTKKVPILNPNGEPEYLLGISEDITERQRAEEELRESESKLQAIFNQIDTGILIIDSATQTIVEANRAVSAMTGLPKERIVGRICHALVCPAEVGRCPVKDLGQRIDQSERKLLQSDGRLIDILKTVYPLKIKGRDCFLESFIDISDRKRAEELLRMSEERVQRAEKMEALGNLAGGVAHDLNNVLGVVIGYAELLLNIVDKASPLRRRLEHIMKGGERASAIVQDLLTLTRRGVASMQVLNLNDLILDGQQLPEYTSLCSQYPFMMVKLDLDPDLMNVFGSPAHLAKSIYNLAANAAESMPAGGILTVRTSNQYLDRPVQGYDEVLEGDYVVLTVSDTGDGIPAADLKRIFEPFYTKKVMGRSGTGLELAVVWGTVKDHHGYINVESEMGIGTTFILYLPVTRERIRGERAAVTISEYTGKGEKILVVDDVEGQRDLAAEMLRKLNYQVESVASGEEAVAYLQEKAVDLIVLDMIMDPGMGGLETYRRIVANHPQQKAIIVSGFSETDQVHAAQALGAGPYIRKPYNLEKLGMAVRKELDRAS
jgi:PAS domain S-box-containing protein